MKEKHTEVLKEALKKLPQYKAPNGAWEKISDMLQTPEEDALRNSLKELSRYQAPDEAWTNIQGQLNGKNRIPTMFRWGIAAVIVVLISFALTTWMSTAGDQVEVAPMTEKKTYPQVPEVEIADFEDQTLDSQAKLDECMAKLNKQDWSQDIRKDMALLKTLTHTRDSLSDMLITGKGLPGTSPRLDMLDLKRKELIDKLSKRVCKRRPISTSSTHT